MCVCVRQWSFWQWFNTTVSLDSLYLHTAALFHGQGVLVPVFKRVLLYHWDQVNTEPKDRQTDRRRHLLCEGRWDAFFFFFFWFGAIKAARLVWNHSGTESLSPASRVTDGSSSIYTFSTLFLCFFPFVSIVFESYYGQFTLFSRAQTTDYFLLLVKCI